VDDYNFELWMITIVDDYNFKTVDDYNCGWLQQTVDDYNFGTMLRIKADGIYDEANTIITQKVKKLF